MATDSKKRYQAFISYRHLPLDKAVAIRLQNLLEKFTPPPQKIPYSNSNKIERIFRDESELPTSGDLGMDIVTALEDSDFLIVLCTPKLKESKWCMREIEYFKELHGGRINRILPILVDGDPAETFPDALKFDTRITFDENGNEIREAVEVEPLACNINAGGDIKKTLKLLNSEFLRIAAPILGCKFDDLFQRHRRRKIRRIISVSVSSFILSFIIAGILTIQSRNVVSSQDTMNIELSNLAYISGDMENAVHYAQLAIQPRNFLMPQILPQARLALNNALGTYNFSDSFRPVRILESGFRSVNTAISPDGRFIANLYAFGLQVIDTQSTEIIAEFEIVNSAMAEAVFLSNNVLIFPGINGITAIDVETNNILWQGYMATAITVSENKCTIATVYLRESRSVIYDANGNVINIIDFGERHQRVPYHDILANPGSNLLELNANGTWLGISFDNSNLSLFDLTTQDSYIEIGGTYEFTNFTGGFTGDIFIFASSGPGMLSDLVAIDLSAMEMHLIHSSQHEFTAYVNKYGLFVAHRNILFAMDLTTGSQFNIAETNETAYIVGFNVSENGAIISNDNGEVKVFNSAGVLTASYNLDYVADFIVLANNNGAAISRNSTNIMLFSRPDNSHAHFFSYTNTEEVKITRINQNSTRIMRYNPWQFRLYDINGSLINEVEIPDGSRAWNLQFDHQSGNLVVIHRNEALRIFSGYDGSLLFENTNLVSTFFADFGISIKDQNARLMLININTGEIIREYMAQGNHGAIAGMVIDSNFLNGREVIGATKSGNNYFFAVSNGTTGTIYNQNGQRQFDISTGQFTEVFFTDNFVISAPMHGSPTVYNLQNGREISFLEQNAHLTNAHQFGDYIVVEYFSYVDADSNRFGILKDSQFNAIGHLPGFTDINTAYNLLFFDFGLGNVWVYGN